MLLESIGRDGVDVTRRSTLVLSSQSSVISQWPAVSLQMEL